MRVWSGHLVLSKDFHPTDDVDVEYVLRNNEFVPVAGESVSMMGLLHRLDANGVKMYGVIRWSDPVEGAGYWIVNDNFISTHRQNGDVVDMMRGLQI